MSYLGMSVKEAVENVNSNVNGWFLPSVQRPYVWGSRYESEKYIAKLFDSILRGYPIGGLIVWNNKNEMPYREFLTDYHNDDISKEVEKGKWSRQDKWLVYDGQQRLQTLFSCLKYSINDRVLVYNLFFDISKIEEDRDKVGFSFCNKNEDLAPNYVRMNEIFVKLEKEKTTFRKEILSKIGDSFDKEDIVEENIDLVWDIFVKKDTKSIAYFPVESPDETTVNEIFQRLNTGGVPLSQSDLLLSKIKEKKHDFEEEILYFTREIFQKTQGYYIDADQILQLLNLLIRGGIRIAPDKTTPAEIDLFIKEWPVLKVAVEDFYTNFIYESFKINNQAIVPRKLAIYPIIIFFKIAHDKSINFKKLNSKTVQNLKKYFILSQINDWNIATIIDNVSKKVIEINKSSASTIFNIDDFKPIIQKNRNWDLFEDWFTSYTWFALKIMTPTRLYNFTPDNKNRYNPEIDHIFPQKGEQDEDYRKAVNIIWNMQPVKGEINNYKRKRNPLEFFISEDGSKYFSEYDFVEPISSEEWKNWKLFIDNRKSRMIKFLKETYGLEFSENKE